MKRLATMMTVGAAVLALVGCSQKKCDKGCDGAKDDKDRVETYEGVLPAADAPGIKYTLTMEYDNADKGDYTLTEQAVGIDNAEATTTQGDFTIYTTTNEGVDKKYVKLVPDHPDRASELNNTSAEVYYFLVDNDSTLTMTNAELQAPASGLDYSLRMVK